MKYKTLHFAALLLSLIIIVSACGDHRTAKNPAAIADEAGFSLPEYSVVSQDDNMDREASAWSEYDYEIKLNNPLSSKQIKELNNLVAKDSHWTYDSAKRIYTYFYSDEESKNIRIDIYVYSNTVKMAYAWYDIFA